MQSAQSICASDRNVTVTLGRLYTMTVRGICSQVPRARLTHVVLYRDVQEQAGELFRELVKRTEGESEGAG